MHAFSLDTPAIGGQLPCAQKKSSCCSSCTVSSGSCNQRSGLSCAAQGMRFKTRVLSAEYITAKVLRAVERLIIPGIKSTTVEASLASFSQLCFSKSLRGVSGASFDMYGPGATADSEPFFKVSQSGGVDVIGDVDATGRLNIGGGAGPTEFSVTEQGTVTTGFAANINRDDASPASFLVANEGDAPQQIVLATQYVGGVPPSSQSVSDGSMDAGSAFILRVDSDASESVTLAPYNDTARAGLSYTQELYEPDNLPPQPGSQGKHVFVGDMSVIAPGRPSTSAPVLDITNNQINMTGDVLVNGKPVVFDYVFPWQETLASGASTFHGPVQQLADRADGYTRTIIGNRSITGGGAELVLAAGYTPAPKRMARFNESDNLAGSVDAAYALRVSPSSSTSSSPPAGGAPDAKAFQIAYVSGSGSATRSPGYELGGSANSGAGSHLMRGGTLVLEEVHTSSTEPIFAAATHGFDARGPIRIRESLSSDEEAPIIERDASDGSLVLGYETNNTAGTQANALSARPTAQINDTRAHIRVGKGHGDDAEVTIGPKLKVGPLSIEPIKDETTGEYTSVQLAFDGEVLMILNKDLIQITKGLQAAELNSGGGSGTSTDPSRAPISFGGVQFGSVPILDNFDADTASSFDQGGAFVDGNGYLRVAYSVDASGNLAPL